ncbi:alkaline ceramidase [Streptococcus orisratti]|uniref:alkaline ceramidase n=1 Tax=Streptococcus orisratti TaxID=114652 RepID=UPI003D0550F1
MLQAGAGKSRIQLTEQLLPLEKFTYCHDDLYCRAIILDDFVFISLDVTSLQDYAIRAMKDKVKASCEVLESHIFISVTHTFSAPHTRSLKALEKADTETKQKNQYYLDLLLQAVEEALFLAKNNLQPVSLSCQNVRAQAQVNRDIELIDGYWLGKNPQDYSNHTIPMLQISSTSGALVGMIYSVDVQSSIIEKIGDGAISSDFIGLTTQKIEDKLNCVALFMLGAAADQIPNVCQESFDSLERCSDELASTILSQVTENEHFEGDFSLTQISVELDGQAIPDMKSLRPTREYHFELQGKKQVELAILTIGDFGLVMLKPELASVTGKVIREQSPFSVTMIATMINGGQKYMVDEKSYDNYTYEAMNSMFARGSAEKVSKAIIKTLKERK